MMDRLIKFLGWSALALVGIQLFSFFSNEVDDESFATVFRDKYGIYALNLPKDVTFAGEEIPFDDPDVIERFDREMLVNTYWQSNSLLMFKKAHRDLPVIAEILKKNGIPEDFKYLPVIESGLSNVVSPAGATGYWQLLKETAKQYGLEVNDEVDERYDLVKSTEAACKYLKEAKEKLGSWTLAAGSYNMGINGMRRQLERQKAGNYYDLLLNSETSRYVFRILAAKEILNNPEKYGFHLREKDLYQHIPTKEVKVNGPIEHFADFALSQGVTYKVLKLHNPWLRQHFLTNKNGKSYSIQIPKKGYYPEVKNVDKLIHMADSTSAEPGDSSSSEANKI